MTFIAFLEAGVFETCRGPGTIDTHYLNQTRRQTQGGAVLMVGRSTTNNFDSKAPVVRDITMWHCRHKYRQAFG
jgi:hypothetical protein